MKEYKELLKKAERLGAIEGSEEGFKKGMEREIRAELLKKYIDANGNEYIKTEEIKWFLGVEA